MKPIQRFSVEVPNIHSFNVCLSTLLLLLFTPFKSHCLDAPETAVGATVPFVSIKPFEGTIISTLTITVED